MSSGLEVFFITYLIVVLAIAAGLGFIPATIAKKKGYSFGLWWFYGWMLFIVAIIHVCLIPDKNAPQTHPAGAVHRPPPRGTADEIMKYKELLDTGVITPEEFEAKKKQLLGQ